MVQAIVRDGVRADQQLKAEQSVGEIGQRHRGGNPAFAFHYLVAHALGHAEHEAAGAGGGIENRHVGY